MSILDYYNGRQFDLTVRRAARPPNTVQETPETPEQLTEPYIEDFEAETDDGNVAGRNAADDSVSFTTITSADALYLKEVSFDPVDGILTFIRNNGEELRITGFYTVDGLGYGPQGDRGETGAPGRDGFDGKEGFTGPTGPTGRVGATGSQGSSGVNGRYGGTGEQGPTGPTGPPGPDGPQGPTGPIGHIGESGPSGCVGPTGPTGDKGPDGATRVVVSSEPPDTLLWGYPL